ncbi:Polyketide cyclase / dehydrase and lipid transport [Micromonospora purpureochromogenes]|uniref:Polyketide cyclase / dehydrase and lipid transport n=1 Tax=Micromonospora purpureochromogenes TaxID=47872 RepID=A0A1C4Z0W0_9ACTN|nr:SRPBCC family protein [Micromonospora purpureochromogenes]SCF26544.1 Polyketide cyclase / dehydrase and lipid transport [Micromonospora purpureochromogenes]
MDRTESTVLDDLEGKGRGTGLPRLLGVVSLALGAGGLLAPRAVARLTGVDDSPQAAGVIPAVAARELGHAAGLLTGRRPGGWAWTRVAGDAADLTLLGRALADRCGERRRRVAVTTAVVAGIAVVDLLAAVRAVRARRARERLILMEVGVTVNRPASEAYRFWRDLENLPRFMAHLEAVRADDLRRSHWTARGPAGRLVGWDAEIVEDRPDELIAWRSLPGAQVPNAGRVRFVPAPGDRGTEVRVELGYAPPAGRVGRAVAKLFGEEPEQQIRDDLRRFKQVLETGEVVRSDASPQGITLHQQLKQRPAQPLPAR